MQRNLTDASPYTKYLARYLKFYFNILCRGGRERQFLANKNYAPKLSSFGIIASVIKQLSAML